MDEMNKEKFTRMPLRKKLQWLLQYYGVKAVVVIVVIVVLVSIIKSVLFPAPPADGIVMIYSDDIYPEYCMQYAEEMSEETGLTIEVTGYVSSDMYGQAAFVTKLSVEQVDVLIVPTEIFGEYEEPLEMTDIVDLKDGTLKMGITSRAGDYELAKYMEDYLEKHI